MINEIQAEYKDIGVPAYKDNPYIEALPPLLERDEIFARIMYNPQIVINEAHNSSIRLHELQEIKNLLIPMTMHITVAHKIAAMMYSGYVSRNPIPNRNLDIFERINEARGNDTLTNTRPLKSTAAIASITGTSGLGKSTTVNRILSMYPQVINHTEYDKFPLPRQQITWIKIDCPVNGNPVELCKDFFAEVDKLIPDARYQMKFGSVSRDPVSMIYSMHTVMNIHALGLLVIDEVQNATGKNREFFLNTIIKMANVLDIPILLIGTPDSEVLFKKSLSDGRKLTTEGLIAWERMQIDSGDWKRFIRFLWDKQVLGVKVELIEEMNKLLYHYSQGITGIATTLFILTQSRVLTQNDDISNVRLLPKDFEETYNKEMKSVHKQLEAIRSGKESDLLNFKDLVYETDLFVQDASKLLNEKVASRLEHLLSEDTQKRKNKIIKKLIEDINDFSIFEALTDEEKRESAEKAYKKNPNSSLELMSASAASFATDKVKAKEKKNKKKTQTKECSKLLDIRNRAIDNKTLIYDELKLNGYIADAYLEFIEGAI